MREWSASRRSGATSVPRLCAHRELHDRRSDAHGPRLEERDSSRGTRPCSARRSPSLLLSFFTSPGRVAPPWTWPSSSSMLPSSSTRLPTPATRPSRARRRAPPPPRAAAPRPSPLLYGLEARAHLPLCRQRLAGPSPPGLPQSASRCTAPNSLTVGMAGRRSSGRWRPRAGRAGRCRASRRGGPSPNHL